jgi:biopolymer transport protein ExbD
MSRPKIPRKSTSVDMTAMCDVAFLLLSFFILTTKPKPSEAVSVSPPNSVSSKIAPQKDVVLITITQDGKAFLSFGDDPDDNTKKAAVLNDINTTKNLGLSPAEITNLVKAPFIGGGFGQMKQISDLQTDQMTGASLPGIPCQDTANNEMTEWVRAIVTAYQNGNMNILLKADNAAKYPAFKNVLTSFKKNDQFHFELVTNAAGVPAGTALYQQNMAGIKPTDE